ncbi:LAFA_0C10022g1_1 [Lachancea sp. 'fantastica']|nr:LAFA_0C10022g1_1 [Lachancea sp. 'fantastica']
MANQVWNTHFSSALAFCPGRLKKNKNSSQTTPFIFGFSTTKTKKRTDHFTRTIITLDELKQSTWQLHIRAYAGTQRRKGRLKVKEEEKTSNFGRYLALLEIAEKLFPNVNTQIFQFLIFPLHFDLLSPLSLSILRSYGLPRGALRVHDFYVFRLVSMTSPPLAFPFIGRCTAHRSLLFFSFLFFYFLFSG